jgi:hypothetical protein
MVNDMLICQKFATIFFQNTSNVFMAKKVEIEVRRYRSQKCRVWIISGVQSFKLDYDGNKEECDWYANMLRKALGLKEVPIQRSFSH